MPSFAKFIESVDESSIGPNRKTFVPSRSSESVIRVIIKHSSDVLGRIYKG